MWASLDEVQPDLQRPYEILIYRNKLDEAMGLISLHVSDSLLFHLDELLIPQDMWLKFDSLFERVNEIRAL